MIIMILILIFFFDFPRLQFEDYIARFEPPSSPQHIVSDQGTGLCYISSAVIEKLLPLDLTGNINHRLGHTFFQSAMAKRSEVSQIFISIEILRFVHGC